jgi:hypothetical protein
MVVACLDDIAVNQSGSEAADWLKYLLLAIRLDIEFEQIDYSRGDPTGTGLVAGESHPVHHDDIQPGLAE